MNKNQVIYVASPYSSKDDAQRVKNFELVTQYVAFMVSEGYTAISPITYGHLLLDYQDMPGDYEFWQNFCISLLGKCDAMVIIKLPGWQESVGIKDEARYADENGIPIYHLEPIPVVPVTTNMNKLKLGLNTIIQELEQQEEVVI